jgi:hypothetical protein
MMRKVIPEHGLKTGGSGQSAGNIAATMWGDVVPDGYKSVNIKNANALISLTLPFGPKADAERFCGGIISLKKINAQPACQSKCQIFQKIRHRQIS